jgi:hypothetical protein
MDISYNIDGRRVPRGVLRSIDRTAHQPLDKDGHVGAHVNGVEPAVELAYPCLKFRQGDLFAGVAAPKSAGDLGDLLFGWGEGLRYELSGGHNCHGLSWKSSSMTHPVQLRNGG